MKDIDFEELDRAVSSLIGSPGDAKKTTAPAQPADDDQPAASDDDSQVKVETKPEHEAPAPEPKEAEDAVVPAAPLISSGRRSGGKFMDVVHPTTNSAKPDVVKPSKTGKVLHPISDTVKPDEAPEEEKPREEHETHHKLHIKAPHHEEPEPAKAEEEETPPEPQAEDSPEESASEPHKQEEAPTSDAPEQKTDEPKWPDPLDLMKNEEPKADEAKPEASATEEPAEGEHHEIAPDAPDPLADADKDSSTAPFLPDAKVEKRPLGAFSGEGENTEAKAEPETALPGDPNAQPSDLQQPAMAQKLPPELEGDIVNVELSEAAGPTPEPEPSADESQKLEDHVKEQLENDDDVKKEDGDGDKPASVGAAAGGAVLTQTMSIPKQYHAAEEAPDTAEHPVFDTKEYHPPIDPHAEHAAKHTIWWVIAAVVLLAGTAIAFGYWVLNGL